MKNNASNVITTKNHPDITWEKIRHVLNRLRVLDEVNPKGIGRTTDAIRESIYELFSLLEQYDLDRKNT